MRAAQSTHEEQHIAGFLVDFHSAPEGVRSGWISRVVLDLAPARIHGWVNYVQFVTAWDHLLKCTEAEQVAAFAFSQSAE